MQLAALEGGFENAPIASAQAFRGIMTAMACPGTIQTVAGAAPPAPLSVAAGAAVLTLCDAETPVHLAGRFDTDALRDWITFHTSAPLVAANQAMFAIGDWTDLQLSDFAIGTSEYPDRSATLIVECAELAAQGAALSGPGIKDSAALSLPEISAFQANAALFPLGLDFIFTCDSRLAALPRTTKVS
ncbi:phosphonate C-P lyase system protein PhnH [Yoonia sp. BS5-3]|uniref:Phosphonate C-P lyase system protein PhnH n=1 Tax=Yoonia phaeophyticola TaxID=3137369 RepID=A0ABZ3IE13_9RHOB